MTIWANAVRAEVGAQLTARGAHYGCCRTLPDGSHAVSWWFPAGRRRRERRLVFRTVGRGLDRWEVSYREESASEYGRATRVHASRSLPAPRDGLGAAVTELLDRGLVRGRVRVVPDDLATAGPSARASAPGSPGVGSPGVGSPGVGSPGVVADGPAPGPRAAAAAASARRPPPPPGRVRVADGLLGVVVAVLLLAACRVDIDLAPSIAAFAVPLLGVSLVWTFIGLSGLERRR